jgi:hypothetical protein
VANPRFARWERIRMSRHGQCRCGVMMTFRKRHGYKARCPGCGKVVRLQPDGPVSAPAASAEIPDALDAFEALPGDSEAKMVAVVDEDGDLTKGIDVEPVTAPMIHEKPWTWQWLAVVGGLVLWVGSLIFLAWWWWQ